MKLCLSSARVVSQTIVLRASANAAPGYAVSVIHTVLSSPRGKSKNLLTKIPNFHFKTLFKADQRNKIVLKCLYSFQVYSHYSFVKVMSHDNYDINN